MLQAERARASGFLAAAGLTIAMLLPFGPGAEAKAPGQRHCHGGVCHRVMSLQETASAVGKLKRMSASHYDDCRRDRHNPCGLTSSGEAYRAHAPDNTASAIHPDGTILLIRNPSTRQAAVVRVNNFGPFKGNRQLDVSRATAERLGFAGRGVAGLEVMVVQAPTAEETRYRKHRRYAAVPGHLGPADNIDLAFMRYADMSYRQRVARLDAVACHLARHRPAPRLGLMTAGLATRVATRG